MLEIKLFGAMSVTTPNGTVTASELGGQASADPRDPGDLAGDPGAEAPAGGPALGRLPAPFVRQHAGELPVRAAPQARPGPRTRLGHPHHQPRLRARPAAAKTDLHEFRTLLQAAEAADPRSALDSSSRPSDWPRGAARRRAVRPLGQPGAGGRPERARGRRHPGRAPRDQPRRAAAVRMARIAVSVDVLAEEAWRLLMRAFWLSGRRSEALRAYSELRTRSATSSRTRRSRPRRCTSRSCATSPSRPAARGRTGATRC